MTSEWFRACTRKSVRADTIRKRYPNLKILEWPYDIDARLLRVYWRVTFEDEL